MGRARSNRVTIRLDDRELRRLSEVSSKTGLRPAAAMRACLMGARPVVVTTGDEEALREVARQVARVGGHTNQIAYRLNSGSLHPGDPRDLRAVARELSGVVGALSRIRGDLAAIRDRENALIREVGG